MKDFDGKTIVVNDEIIIVCPVTREFVYGEIIQFVATDYGTEIEVRYFDDCTGQYVHSQKMAHQVIKVVHETY